ncbi:helix-turn-helix domain-containing protein [Arthrobacter sp. I2-34]|uniref:Helix-turn-helix domain-containing protein n=1 Tax=Arthrobacter hankyongi TaxID=2904801 RepID=A0ABS9L3A2_9MICC|nr:helix-turn-helix domain-containing protein [Arthrobacter hankyongi]MCG2621169.1 helix-turn-helix domain-containing protein [Arthrobacter hankyongi]
MTQATAGMRPHGLTRFSTAGLPGAHRIQLWEEHNARALVGLEARTLSGAVLEASELNLILPRLQLAQVTGTPHIVERSARQIAEYPAESVVAYFALEGEGFFYHRDGCEILQPGQAILYDADQPFLRGFSHGLKELALKVPRRTFSELTGRSGLNRPQVFGFRGAGSGSQPGSAEALAQVLGRALSGRSTDWDQLETSVLDLLARLLGADGGPAGHLAAAQAYIDAHLADPQLSAGRIAAAAGISDRQLSRVFAEAGSSVPGAILDARLQAARRQLKSPDAARLKLGDLSAALGFASQAHFSRSYKEKFGLSPLQDRKATS